MLSIYDLEIEYWPGIQHGNADSLSCHPCTQCRQESHFSDKKKRETEDLQPCHPLEHPTADSSNVHDMEENNVCQDLTQHSKISMCPDEQVTSFYLNLQTNVLNTVSETTVTKVWET